ncbi:MAG: hypothetical protein KGZ88_01735 [Methylomicrobium sp.]|nr:hypothetical protein [Methylomicrobium sp.]PPD24119.1 MAG: hypothetical protein CTY24_01995 [Methylobacter sp.]
MRVVILSGSGNVGKTVVAEHLLSLRLNGALLISFGGAHVTRNSGQWRHRDEVSAVFADLLEHERCIVDVAGGATPSLLVGIHRFASIHESIDCFMIPVTSSTKVQIETIALLERLANSGVEANSIRILFNRVESNVADEFGVLIGHINAHGGAVAHHQSALFENELFDILAEENLTIQQVLDDETDYKTLLREQREADAALREDWSNRYAIKCLTKHVKRNLDDCYAALFC